MQLFKELQRRNVIRVAIGYIVSSWLLLQVADLVLDIIGSPDWVLRTIALVFALGFPIVVFFSWAYEVTPEGVKRESEIDRSQSITHVTGRKLDYSILAVLVISLAYFVWETSFSDRTGDVVKPQGVESVAESQAIELADTALKITSPDILSIAVLPFENRSNREEDQFFTDGIHDDLLTTIAKIGSMKVISRTSVMEYKSTTKKLPQIAEELGVANILEGGIQRSGNQVRINVQLIDAATDVHLWAEIYDRELTAENLFAIQSEISKAIAEALQATLSPDEEQRIDLQPTDNLLAYDAFMRGRQLLTTRNSSNLQQAANEFNKAVELDPGFALAWVGVADSHSLLIDYGTLANEEALPIVEHAVNRALTIDDQLGEAYASLGSLYESRNQLEEAEAAFLKSTQLSPNYATAWHWYGSFLYRYPLRLEENFSMFQKAAELDPRSSIIRYNLGVVYRMRGSYSMAERKLKEVIELDPDFALGYYGLAELYYDFMGDYVRALPYAIEAQERDKDNISYLLYLVDIYLELGDLATAETIRERMSELDANHPAVGFADVLINVHKNNLAGAHETINWLLPKIADHKYLSMLMGYVELLQGDIDRSREIYLSVVPGWKDPHQWQELIEMYTYHGCVVAWIFMNTDDTDLGQKLLQQSTVFMDELLPAVTEHADYVQPELCYLAAGETEKSLQAIETQLAHNHLGFWNLFMQAPIYDLIRDEPRFQAAMLERERRIAVQREVIDLERKAGK